ncbi:MAG: hypothetical protein Kow0047_31920 [Anaerolineae bacterium]
MLVLLSFGSILGDPALPWTTMDDHTAHRNGSPIHMFGSAQPVQAEECSTVAGHRC